ncbi:hypothetical protein F4780DRAFT_727070 [Xylariomycetidae sp. FL0641]|nr:hypothetical protein F4780DRAFT_727070 [Xylariomycetidae sp. FL0641]
MHSLDVWDMILLCGGLVVVVACLVGASTSETRESTSRAISRVTSEARRLYILYLEVVKGKLQSPPLYAQCNKDRRQLIHRMDPYIGFPDAQCRHIISHNTAANPPHYPATMLHEHEPFYRQWLIQERYTGVVLPSMPSQPPPGLRLGTVRIDMLNLRAVSRCHAGSEHPVGT